MSKFEKRTTAPTGTEKWYSTPFNPFFWSYPMPNCTAYAWGRFAELIGEAPPLSTGNAEYWYLKDGKHGYGDDGYERGNTPKKGAIICWRKGEVGGGYYNEKGEFVSDGAGHVAVVEDVYADNSILISESAWGGSYFKTSTLYPSNNYSFSSAQTFQGFIYNPIDFDAEDTPPNDPDLDTSEDIDFTGLEYSTDAPPTYCPQSSSSGYTGTTTMDIKGIVVHSSQAKGDTIKTYVQPSDDASYKSAMLELIGENTTYSDWNHKTTAESYNACIGKLADGSVSTVQTMPWKYRTWGCGGGSNGTCNNGWIQIFICEHDVSDEEYFNNVYSELRDLVAYLCKLYSLDPKGTTWCGDVPVPVVMSHNEAYRLGVATHAQDIQSWFPLHGKSMQSVREDVFTMLNSVDIPVIPEGSLVTINDGAITQDGDVVQPWMQTKKWYVEESNDTDIYCLLGKVENSETTALNEWFLKKDLTVTTSSVAVEKPPVEVDKSTVDGLIWSTLRSYTFSNGKQMTSQGAAGIMGNLYAESGLRSNNMENSYEKSITNFEGVEADEWYTAAVDSGEYDQFVEDEVGYGLAQWTFYSRKQALLDYVQKKNVSISDLDAQLEYLLAELQSKSEIVDVLVDEAKTLADVSDTILTKFENPADQSDSVKTERQEFGKIYYDKFAEAPVCTHKNTSGTSLGVVTDAIEATCMQSGYTGDIICSNCDEVIQYGSVIPKTDHDWDWRGICKTCEHISDTFTPEELVSKEDLQEVLQILYRMLER